MIRRRGFLIGLGSLGMLAAVGSWRVARTTSQQAIISVLRKRLSYLRLDEAGMLRFANDLVAKGDVSPVRLRTLAAFAPLYNRLPLYGNGWLKAIRHGEERVTTAFLLSSDFFRNGRDETQVVHYLGYYDPMRAPRSVACRNPFAVPLGPDNPNDAAPAWPAAVAVKR